jgi:transcriptional regulator with XRE-family HTH domain
MCRRRAAEAIKSEVIALELDGGPITYDVIAGDALRLYDDSMTPTPAPIGQLFRAWREQRRMSQLELACEANISQKHLSFIESGRSAPSREMIVHLADHLDVPLRERNTLLLSAGFAPIYRERAIDDPALVRARATVEKLLKAHEPFPALAVDRRWNMIAANAAVAALIGGVDEQLLKPPVNVLRLSLHPQGLAPLIANLAEWRHHLLERTRRQVRLTRDAALDALLSEISAYPAPDEKLAPVPDDEIAIPLRLRTPAGVLSFFSTVTVFGTAVEITLAEISLEAFYPADDFTAGALKALS